MREHYRDGNLITANRPAELHRASREAMAHWGPLMPRSFTKPKLRLTHIAALLSNPRSSPDLTVAKHFTLARSFG